MHPTNNHDAVLQDQHPLVCRGLHNGGGCMGSGSHRCNHLQHSNHPVLCAWTRDIFTDCLLPVIPCYPKWHANCVRPLPVRMHSSRQQLHCRRSGWGAIKWTYTWTTAATCSSMEGMSSVYSNVLCCSEDLCNKPDVFTDHSRQVSQLYRPTAQMQSSARLAASKPAVQGGSVVGPSASPTNMVSGSMQRYP